MGKKRELIEEWEGIYEKHFYRPGALSSFNKNIIPDYYNPDEHLAVLLRRDIKLEEILEASQKVFDIHLNDLSGKPFETSQIHDYVNFYRDCCSVFKNDQNNHRVMAYSFRNKELFRKESMTLRERLLLGLYYFEYYGEIMDEQGGTHCLGSDYRFYEHNGQSGTISVSHNNVHGYTNIDYIPLPDESEQAEKVLIRERIYFAL